MFLRIEMHMSHLALRLPPSEGFFNLLDAVLRIEGQAHIAQLFRGSECSLEGSEIRLRGVHDYFRARINIAVPIERVHFFTDEVRHEVRRAANQILAPSADYRVVEIKLIPWPAPAQSQQVTVAELISQVNRLRSSRADIEVRIDTAKELLETTCRVILSERNPTLQVGSGWDIRRLCKETEKVLTLVPAELSRASQDATRKILEKLWSLAQNLGVKERDARQAGMAVWAASTLTVYLIDSHQLECDCVDGQPGELGG